MKTAITVPDKMMPTPDPVDPCPCQFRPFRLYYKKMEIFWDKDPGEHVEKDETVCTGEIEKKTVEFKSPCDGTLCEICVESGDKAGVGDVLGYIEEQL